MADRPRLIELSDHFGILPAYVDLRGHHRLTENTTRVLLLSAMGMDASSEESAQNILAGVRNVEAARLLQPIQVIPAGSSNQRLSVNRPHHWEAPVEWRLEVAVEGGETVILEGRSDHCQESAIGLRLPPDLVCGYHRLEVMMDHKGKHASGSQLLVVVPPRCYSLNERIGPGRGFGIWTNLYSLRTERNWGVGDATDAATLARYVGPQGADFVGLSPLHATFNRMPGISPYSPVSRLFRNPIYIDVEAVPELSGAPEAQKLLTSAGFQKELAQLRAAKKIDYAGIYKLKTRILRILHAAFDAREARGATQRGCEYGAYLGQGGRRLLDYATFMAMFEFLQSNGRSAERQDLPPYGDPAVAAFRDANHQAVDYHCYVQFELDRQFASSHVAAAEAGMRLGLYHDLALGSVSDGSDVWALPDLFAQGVEVGAPPDDYSDSGQKWGFPPVNPHRLRARGYDYWIDLLRASLKHAGMLRLDHVMGLLRQFWVPVDDHAVQGAYVRYPQDELLGILALESQRHHTVIVGEDLGTIPPELPAVMDCYEILPSRLMVFEREWDGSFRSPQWYHPRALVMASNHDHPPLAGLWTGRDLQIRHEAGVPLPGNATSQRPCGEDHFTAEQAERRKLCDALRRAFLDIDPEFSSLDESAQAILAAAYSFLTRTPCRLLGISLDDLGLEEEPVNLPGISVAVYPSWSRKMTRALSEILQDPACHRTLELVRRNLQSA